MTTVDDPACEHARRMFAADNASRALGIEITEMRPGYAATTMTVTDHMVNGYAITHGGYVFLLADTTFALACNSFGQTAVAAHADIRFLRPTRAGDTLTAVANMRNRHGRNGIYDVTVTGPDGAIAEFRGDSRVVRAG
ncbi:hydroxyphenylacetyl-CoA thioesterase PaaI [Nocardia sp. NEAU-G5]|uniref:Hydroxyphenylacetyl-CoA thioesterase PaaI n=1 Tax=Nocardia albiluteola TaxID=2842303 RepID=A0ABS6AYI7_9NOCA|nr:hydroxyphenylacetyl-CoA thioesterase PaaI [Nocardia albiluteola]MBU3062276.1 hydroxyphenylacetyl-CoA thioesterase PaaI [Nocardia albiluteola]